MKEVERKNVRDCCHIIDGRVERMTKNVEEISIYKSKEEAIKSLDAEGLDFEFPIIIPSKSWLMNEPNKKWVEVVGGNEYYRIIALVEGVLERKILKVVGYKLKIKIKECCNEYTIEEIKQAGINPEKEIELYGTEKQCLSQLKAKDLEVMFSDIHMEYAFYPKRWKEYIGGNKEYGIIAVFENAFDKKCTGIAAFVNEKK